MTSIISLLIATLVLYILFLQIRESNELTRTKFRFRYFALRDELAMLVAQGKLKEDSWEYRHIIETLNFHISAVEHISIFRIADVLADYHLSSKEDVQVKSFSKKLDRDDVAKIVFGYMEATYDLIKRNSRVQIALARVIGEVAREVDIQESRAARIATTRNRALSTIRSHQSVVESRLSVA
ncbi:MAG: hypothetical protein IPO13_13450 [Rhodocyclaceae bacterium]|nr:hypothetical protein [Rhodocyclaceae bacterium]